MNEAVLILALYVPFPLEDTHWSPDPIQWESGRALPCIVTGQHGDGTVDVLVTGIDGRKHVRQRQNLTTFDNPDFGARSWVILRERGS